MFTSRTLGLHGTIFLRASCSAKGINLYRYYCNVCVCMLQSDRGTGSPCQQECNSRTVRIRRGTDGDLQQPTLLPHATLLLCHEVLWPSLQDIPKHVQLSHLWLREMMPYYHQDILPAGNIHITNCICSVCPQPYLMASNPRYC